MTLGPRRRVVVQGDGELVLERELAEPGLDDGGPRLDALGVGLVVGVLVEPVDLVGGCAQHLKKELDGSVRIGQPTTTPPRMS
jgi:hypothetical protein